MSVSPVTMPAEFGGSLRNTTDLLYLSGEAVRRASERVDFVGEVREALRLHGLGQTHLPDETYLPWRTPGGDSARSLNMPGYIGGTFGVAGTKVINSNPGNPAAGIPRASGLTLLFDDASARIVCVMEGAYISGMRTAAVTAVAADLLAAPAVTDMALLGAGALARSHITVLAPRLPDRTTIRVYDLVRERALALAAWAATDLGGGVQIQVTDTAEEAVRGAQLVVPVTTTTTGYIPFRWLAPGTLVVNISLDDVEEDVVLRSDAVIVDDWPLVCNDDQRLLGRMYRAGTLRCPDDDCPLPAGTARVRAQLGDLLCGRLPGRTGADEIILVNPFGLAIEDLAVAVRVYQRAVELGLGVVLPR